MGVRRRLILRRFSVPFCPGAALRTTRTPIHGCPKPSTRRKRRRRRYAQDRRIHFPPATYVGHVFVVVSSPQRASKSRFSHGGCVTFRKKAECVELASRTPARALLAPCRGPLGGLSRPLGRLLGATGSSFWGLRGASGPARDAGREKRRKVIKKT